MRVSAQKNKFWVHQIDIKKGTVSPPAGTSESSKTGYTTYDTKESIKENVLYVKNDIMNSQESQEGEDDFTGFNEPDVSEDGVTYESRFFDKLSTINNADEILKAAKNWIGRELEHQRKDDIVEFAEAYVRYRVSNRGRLNGAAVLYDITDIKNIKITESPFTMADKNPQRRKNDSVNKSLPQNTDGVKNDSSVSEFHFIAIPFSDEFKSDKRKRYAVGGGSIDQARVEGYIGVCLTSRQRNQ